MRLKLFLMTSSLILSGCGGMPPKPALEICFPQIIEPLEKSYCLCGMTEGEEKNLTELAKKPLKYCDKATAFPPQSWEKAKNYIDKLENYAKTHCSK
jgi:hypothetical protein